MKEYRINIVKNIEDADVVTHGGIFHADEVFATVFLSLFFGVINVFRTFRVPENVPSRVKVVYDIGGGDFDHHQPGGNGCRGNGVPYAAAGLIWLEYGQALCSKTPNRRYVWDLIDRDLVQGIDAIDNGKYPIADYPASAMSISEVISGFNPTWDSDESSDEAFVKACDFAYSVFMNTYNNCVSKSRAREDVEKAIAESEGHIMVLDQYMPWQDYIFDSENPKAKDIWYVIFPSNRGGYNWQCVPDAPGSFGQRKPVPEEWKGLRDDELREITGVSDAVFVHPAGFIGGAESLEGAKKIAEMASLR